MSVAVGTKTLCLLSVPVFGAAETPNEQSQASSAGLHHPQTISHICRMPQLGHPEFISHRENLCIDGLLRLSLSLAQCTPALFITTTTVCPFSIRFVIHFCKFLWWGTGVYWTPLTAWVVLGDGTGWSLVKYLLLLWTYCNSSRLLPVL